MNKYNMEDSRTKNTKRNMASGIAYKIVAMLLPFIVKTIMIYTMGVYYTGLNSLFYSILQVLNLAELGFSSAIVYNMYKPLAENDTDMVCALLYYYRKIYYIIGLIVFVLGMVILPFIPKLINGAYPKDVNIYVLFLLYLLNSVLSYWLFAYKASLFSALQRSDILNKVYMSTLLFMNIGQLCVLIFTQDMYLYVIVAIATTLLNNALIQILSIKKYPQYFCRGNLERSIRKGILKQVTGIMLEKFGDTFRNSFDSIIISSFIGLSFVTIYSNYYYVFSSVYAVLLIISNSMVASVGNSVAKETIEKNYNDLIRFQFIFCGIICFCCTSCFCLYQPFMMLWVGEKLMFPFLEMSLFCIYFFVLNINNTCQMYYVANGLWWNAKVFTVLEAVGNLLLNILLGKILGVKGVLIATIITIFFFQFVPRTYITFKFYFKKSPCNYYLSTLLYGVVSIISSIVSHLACELVKTNGIVGLFIRLCICVVISITVFTVVFVRTRIERETIDYLKSKLLN